MMCICAVRGPQLAKNTHFSPHFKDFLNPFGVTLGSFCTLLGSLWAYDGGFGTLWNHFAITLESLRARPRKRAVGKMDFWKISEIFEVIRGRNL